MFTDCNMKPCDVKRRIRPSEFYLLELETMPVPRRVRGWVDGGLCPFHADRHRGNFRVNLESGAYHCFACGASGSDIFDFLMHRDGVSFSEALHYLNKR
jgi:DNA primase